MGRTNNLSKNSHVTHCYKTIGADHVPILITSAAENRKNSSSKPKLPSYLLRGNPNVEVCSMGSMEGVSSKELMEAQSHLWNHTFSFVNSMSLKCAIELGIPDAIHKHGKPISLFDLANSLSISPSKIPCFGRLMRLLVHSGIFSSENKAKEDLFSLTTVSKILVQGETTSMSPLILYMLDQKMLKPWHFLSALLTRQEPSTAFEIAHKISLWEATGKIPEFNRVINEAMACDARFIANKTIMRDCGEVFGQLRSLVDVGGGRGNLARAVAEAFPHVKCIVLDLPHVVADLEESEGVRAVGGDMFEFIPPADATLLKWVLHVWSDEECVAILKRCKQATPCREDGGKVIIIEMVMKTGIGIPKELTETQLLFDVCMMVHTTGKQRCEYEWKKIFIDAGFKDYKIIPVLGLRSIIEVYH